MRISTLLLILATGTTALVAGLLYGFSVAVNPGLARLPDAAYIRAMQAINVAILNPAFAVSFFGAPLLLPLAAALHRRAAPRRFRLLALAAGIYLPGVFGVTLGANVPLNEALARFPVANASPTRVASARAAFAGPWNRWHTVRTAASLVALGLALGACVRQE